MANNRIGAREKLAVIRKLAAVNFLAAHKLEAITLMTTSQLIWPTLSTGVSLYANSELVLSTTSLLICKLAVIIFESVAAITKTCISKNYLTLGHISVLVLKLAQSVHELGAGHVKGAIKNNVSKFHSSRKKSFGAFHNVDRTHPD